MLMEIKDKKIVEFIEQFLIYGNKEYKIYKDVYRALSYTEAKEALDHIIETEDVFISKEDYENCLKQATDDLHNNDEDIMQDLTCLARDMAHDVLKQCKVVEAV